MRHGWLVAVLAACTDESAGGPPPWTSGTLVRAQVFEGEGFRALAGRTDPMLQLQCDLDDANAPAFASCPREVYLLWRDTACVMNDIAVDPANAGFDRYAMAATDRGIEYLELGEPYTGTIVYRASGEQSCSIPASGMPARIARPIDRGALRLGTIEPRRHGDVNYDALVTSDGFEVITYIAGETSDLLDGTGRLRARYRVRGGVRMYTGLFDTERDAPCVTATAADGTRCVPANPATVWRGDLGTCRSGMESRYTEAPGPAVVLEPSTTGRPRIIAEYECDVPEMFYSGGSPGTPCASTQGYSCRETPGVFPSLALVTE